MIVIKCECTEPAKIHLLDTVIGKALLNNSFCLTCDCLFKKVDIPDEDVMEYLL